MSSQYATTPTTESNPLTPYSYVKADPRDGLPLIPGHRTTQLTATGVCPFTHSLVELSNGATVVAVTFPTSAGDYVGRQITITGDSVNATAHTVTFSANMIDAAHTTYTFSAAVSSLTFMFITPTKVKILAAVSATLS